MRIAIVLEDRNPVFDLIKGFIGEVDPQLRVLRFQKFEDFAFWFRKNFIEVQEKPKGTPAGDGDEEESSDPEMVGVLDDLEIALMISNHRIMGYRHKALIKKLNEFFSAQEVLAEGKERLPILFVVNETDEKFDIEQYKETYFDNFLFKPFDKQVCLGKILWAIHGKEAISKLKLYKEAPQAPVEMRKDVQTLELSELGFKTLCSRELEKNAVAKYYGSDFLCTGENEGIFAINVGSQASRDHVEEFEVDLKFIGIDTKKIRAIRAKLEKEVKGPTKQEASKVPSKPIGVVLLMEEKAEASQLKEQLEELFQNIEIKIFHNYIDFLLNADPEFGATELIEQQSGKFVVEEVLFEFDQKSGTFLRTDPIVSGENIFGIPKKQLPSLKPFLLAQLDPDERTGVLEFWDRAAPEDVLTLQISDGRSSFIVSLCERAVVAKETNTVVSFKLRPATREEVVRYMANRGDIPRPLGAIFVSERIADFRDIDFWQGVKTKLVSLGFHLENDLNFYRVGTSALKDFELLDRCLFFQSNFIKIIDQRYLGLTLGSHIPQLNFKREKPLKISAPISTEIQVGVLVDVKQINEVNLILTYKREIKVGRYRWFTFWDVKTKQVRSLLAKCVDSEKDPENKGMFLNYFLFYGLADLDNSFLRGWMIEQYRMSKAAKDKKK